MAKCSGSACRNANPGKCDCACFGQNHPQDRPFTQALGERDGREVCPIVVVRPEEGVQSEDVPSDDVALVVYATLRESIGLRKVFEELANAVEQCFLQEGWKSAGPLGEITWQPLDPGSDDRGAGGLVAALHLTQMIFAALGGRLVDWDPIISAFVEGAATFAADEEFDRQSAQDPAGRALEGAGEAIKRLSPRAAESSLVRLRRLLAVVAAVNITQDPYTFSHTTGRGSKKVRTTFAAVSNEAGRSIAIEHSTFVDALKLRTSRRPLIAKKGQTKRTVPADCASIKEMAKTLESADQFARERLNAIAPRSFTDANQQSKWLDATRSLPHFWCEFFIETVKALDHVEGALTQAFDEVAKEVASALHARFPQVPENPVRVVAKFLLKRLASAVGASQGAVSRNVCRALAVLSCPDPRAHDIEGGGNELDDICLIPLFRAYATTALRESAKATLKDKVDAGLGIFLATG